jgi:hypothetical protein
MLLQRATGSLPHHPSPMAHLSTINADRSLHVTVVWFGLDLLNRLAKVYMAPDATFPAPSGTRLHVRYAIDRIGEVGPRGASA